MLRIVTSPLGQGKGWQNNDVEEEKNPLQPKRLRYLLFMRTQVRPLYLPTAPSYTIHGAVFNPKADNQVKVSLCWQITDPGREGTHGQLFGLVIDSFYLPNEVAGVAGADEGRYE